MFSEAQRIFLVLVTVAVGGVLLSRGAASGWGLLLAAAVWGVGYFAYGSAALAFRHVQRGDMLQAQRALAQTRFPRLLTRQARAYREWVLGSLAIHGGNLEAGADHYRAADRAGPRTSNDRALIKVMLAEAEFRRGNKSAAIAILEEAVGIPHGEKTRELVEVLRGDLGSAGGI